MLISILSNPLCLRYSLRSSSIDSTVGCSSSRNVFLASRNVVRHYSVGLPAELGRSWSLPYSHCDKGKALVESRLRLARMLWIYAAPDTSIGKAGPTMAKLFINRLRAQIFCEGIAITASSVTTSRDNPYSTFAARMQRGDDFSNVFVPNISSTSFHPKAARFLRPF